MKTEPVLYDFWRSSAAYRVRIALELKKVAYQRLSVDLAAGEQRGADYTARNPQALIPALEIDGHFLTQSLAIIDYLDQTRPDPPLLPRPPAARAEVLARSLVIVADIHPLNNLRVLKMLRGELGQEDEGIQRWYHHWIEAGFAALEALAPETGLWGGATPDLCDICLVPQMFNARRFAVSLEAFPRLVRIDQQLCALPAFAAAAPDAVKP